MMYGIMYKIGTLEDYVLNLPHFIVTRLVIVLFPKVRNYSLPKYFHQHELNKLFPPNHTLQHNIHKNNMIWQQ